MSTTEVDVHTAHLVDALRAAHAAGLGAPDALQEIARAHARARREAGEDIARVLLGVKAMVREHSGGEEPACMPRMVGWTVAGFFDGTELSDHGR